jgi:hypothetical protein
MLKPTVRLERKVNKILSLIRELPYLNHPNLSSKDTDRIYKVITTQAYEASVELLRNNTHKFKLENDDAPNT